MQLNRNVRPEELQRQIRRLEGREFLLQVGAFLFVFLVVLGFIAVTLSSPLWKPRIPWIRDPRFVSVPGFIVLSVFFGRVLYRQWRALSNAREQLVRTALGTEGAEKLRLIDVLTGLPNRQYLEQFGSKELAVAERLELSLTFLMVDVQDFKSLNARFGRAAGRILKGVVELLRTSFRPSDTLIRYGGDDFLLLMLGCNEQQAQGAVERLLAKVDRWNQENAGKGYKISLRYCTAAYSNGTSIATLLETLEQKMHEQKHEQPTGKVLSTRERP